jgi:regulator of protease activity HflC (stomatin/prohibitin superfamily)
MFQIISSAIAPEHGHVNLTTTPEWLRSRPGGRRHAPRRSRPASHGLPQHRLPQHQGSFATPAAQSGGPPGWFRRLLKRPLTRRLLTGFLSVVGLCLIIALSGARVATESAGTVGVVRNGGPFDNRGVRQVLMPGQKLTWIGWYSQAPHVYPASNVTRTYEVSSDPKRGARTAPDVFSLPTKDGVQVALQGVVYVRFIGEKDITELEAFDVGPGTRRFPAADGQSLYPWQGDAGFSAMLDSMLRPVLDSELRREVAQFSCAQLVASCALVRTTRGHRAPVTDSSIGLIEQGINDSLEPDLFKTLGHRWFWDVRFRVTAIALPENVQSAIDQVQAEYAQVNGAKAQVLQARYQNLRNRLLAQTYDASPALAMIEALKSVPKGATVIFNTGKKQPSILAGK